MEEDRMNFYRPIRTRNQGNGHWHQWVIFSALMLLSIVGPAFAQLPTATILGVVKDSSGAAVPGATLTVRNSATGLVRTVVSDASDGSYRFPVLPVGNYDVSVSRSGFKTDTRQG